MRDPNFGRLASQEYNIIFAAQVSVSSPKFFNNVYFQKFLVQQNLFTFPDFLGNQFIERLGDAEAGSFKLKGFSYRHIDSFQNCFKYDWCNNKNLLFFHCVNFGLRLFFFATEFHRFVFKPLQNKGPGGYPFGTKF